MEWPQRGAASGPWPGGSCSARALPSSGPCCDDPCGEVACGEDADGEGHRSRSRLRGGGTAVPAQHARADVCAQTRACSANTGCAGTRPLAGPGAGAPPTRPARPQAPSALLCQQG